MNQKENEFITASTVFSNDAKIEPLVAENKGVDGVPHPELYLG